MTKTLYLMASCKKKKLQKNPYFYILFFYKHIPKTIFSHSFKASEKNHHLKRRTLYSFKQGRELTSGLLLATSGSLEVLLQLRRKTNKPITKPSFLAHVGIRYTRIMQRGVSDCRGMREADKKKKKGGCRTRWL